MKKPPLLLTIGTAVVLIGGGAAAYWFLTHRGGSPDDLPIGSNVVPQEALMTISISTNERQWRTLRTFGTPGTQAALDQQLAGLRDRFLTEQGLDYERDIQPWVGDEMTIAFLPPVSETAASPEAPAEDSTDEPDADEPTVENENADENENAEANRSESPLPPELEGLDPSQPVAIVLPIANPAKAQEVLAGNKATADWSEREYKGVQLRETQATDGSTTQYSAATLGTQFLVMTTDPAVTEQVVDAYKENPSIADTPGYRDAFRAFQAADVFAKLYVNVPAATALAETNAPQPVPPQGLSPIEDSQGLAAIMTLESNGIRFQGVSWLKPDSDRRYEVRNEADEMPKRLPTDTLMMVSGDNLQRFWQDYSANAQARPLTPFHPDNLRSGLESMTGLSLEDDLLSWMAGEFSLALVPIAPPETEAPETPENQPTTGGVAPVFMVQVSDRNRAEQTLEELDEVLSSRYRFQVQESEVNRQPVVNWVSPFASLTVTRGWLDNDTVFLALGEAGAQTLIPAPSPSLADNSLFKSAVATGPNPNNGHFFINLDRLLSADSSVPLPPLPPQSQEFANAIEAIGVTAATQDARTTRYDIYVALEKGDRPQELPSPQTEASPEPEAEESP